MARPQIKVNGGSPGVKGSVAALSTVTLTLDSLVGVRSVAWSVENTDETANTSDYTLTITGSRGEIASFAALGLGTAVIVRVTINGGLVQGVSVPGETTNTIKVFVPTIDGLEVGATGETFESDPVHGTTVIHNAAIRALATVTGAVLGVPIKTALYVETANLSLTGAATIDAFAVATGDEILAIGQSAPEENGLYTANTAGAWTRHAGFDSEEEIRGTIVIVVSGATRAGRIYKNTNSGSVVVGTTALTFAQLPNVADKTLLDTATSAATLNSIAKWDAAANMNANAFYGSGSVASLGLLRGPHLATFVGMRNDTNTGDVALLSGRATNAVTLGSDECYDVELRGRTTGTVTCAASGTGTYLTVSYDSGSAVTSVEALATLKLWASAGAGTVRIVSDNIEIQDSIGGALLAIGGGGAGFFGSVDFGGGVDVIHVDNATTIPTSNPATGGILYVEAGALKYRGSGGTITPIAPA